jgi:hypothetical protein
MQTRQMQVQRGSRAIQDHRRGTGVGAAAVHKRRGIRRVVVDPAPQLTKRGRDGAGIEFGRRACCFLEVRSDGQPRGRFE